jgi:ankyrin repeat protein
LQKSYDVDAEIDRLATAQNEGKVLVDGQVLEAVRAGSRASVENVLKELPGVNIPVFYGTDTPLHLAAERNPNPEVVALLLDRGADIHARNSTGCYMPLHLAVQHNPNPEVVALLLDRGADIHAQTLGLTTLHWAVGGVVNPKLEVVALLLDWGADVHAKNDESETPLHEAARDGNVEEAVLLLDHGADIHAEDVWGRTPLHEAARDGNVEVVALLLNRGADIRAEDVWGRTPCRMAQDWLGYFAGTLELERLCAL